MKTIKDKTSTNENDLRIAHLRQIRKRLLAAKNNYCKQTGRKLGPDSIKNYLWSKHVYTSKTTIQNMFDVQNDYTSIDISAVLALCDWWGLNGGEILAFPDQSNISSNNNFTKSEHQVLLTDSAYNGEFYCYFFRISGTDSSFTKPFPYSLPKKEDLIQGTITFDINPEMGSKAIFEYNLPVHRFNLPDEFLNKRCTCFPMVSTLNNNIYLDFFDQQGCFYYIFFDHQVFINGPLYFRIGGMVTEAAEYNNGPLFQKIVLFHKKPDDSQEDLIRGLLNINPNNLIISPEQLEALSTDDEIRDFVTAYQKTLDSCKKELYCFNETLITKEPGSFSEYDAKRILVKLRHFTYSQNQIQIGRDADAHRIARKMQIPIKNPIKESDKKGLND